MPLNRRAFLETGFLATLAASLRPAFAALVAEAGLPAYYADHLAARAAKIKTLAGSGNPAFFFFTDPHIKSNHRMSGRVLAELVRRTGVTRVLCGGDYCVAFSGKDEPRACVDGMYARLLSDWRDPIEAAGGRLLLAKGNHDLRVHKSRNPKEGGFAYSSGHTREKLIAAGAEMKHAVYDSAEKDGLYYYRDDEAAKTRFIVVDTSDGQQAEDNSASGGGLPIQIRAPQMAWLAEKALGTVPPGYGVVVMHHVPVAPFVATPSMKGDQRFAAFRQLLEAYQNRGKWSWKGLSHDFTGRYGGDLVLDLTGHHHSDRFNFFNGLLHVTVACDAAYGDYIRRTPFSGVLPKKTKGTIHEQTFDAFVHDRAARLLHAVRVGGGQDRTWRLDPVLAQGPMKLSVRTLKGPVTWTCFDADRVKADEKATVPEVYWKFFHDHGTVAADGTFTPGTKGTSVIVACDAALNKEIFRVEVV